MKFSIWKIINGKSFGTGFICIITNNEKQFHLAALFACNHVINNKDINLKKQIDFEFGNKKLKIKLDEQRIIYKSYKNEYDTTNKSIYIIHYPDGKETNYSLGIIKDTDMNKIKIFHYCSTEHGSSAASILNLNTYIIVGKHYGKMDKFNFNYGALLKLPVILFMDLFEPKLKRKMKERLNKISYLNYFLGNKFFHDKDVKLLDEIYFINLYDNKKKIMKKKY